MKAENSEWLNALLKRKMNGEEPVKEQFDVLLHILMETAYEYGRKDAAVENGDDLYDEREKAAEEEAKAHLNLLNFWQDTVENNKQ